MYLVDHTCNCGCSQPHVAVNDRLVTAQPTVQPMGLAHGTSPKDQQGTRGCTQEDMVPGEQPRQRRVVLQLHPQPLGAKLTGR